ncbi:MAG: hypothetical protein OXI71_11465 [Gemmatimonadota bacterium]|nr:hypothetical protein [Gemmatimonadota bacterium]MXX85377.1 hypothetical protein [Acidobacteriota bacterium]MYG74551.1 hypothetical protein [Acidobacteriota bacterium]
MADNRHDHASTPGIRRLGASARGMTRVEVSVPLKDVPLLRSVARALREDARGASRLRELLESEVGRAPARTGTELVDLLRASPLRETELEIARDRSLARPIDLE